MTLILTEGGKGHEKANTLCAHFLTGVHIDLHELKVLLGHVGLVDSVPHPPIIFDYE